MIHHAKTVDQAINDLEEFFLADIWYAKNAEWKTEEDMQKYIRMHFGGLREEIKLGKLQKKK